MGLARFSCRAWIRPADAQREASHLEWSRGGDDDDDETVWISKTCYAVSDACSSCAPHPPRCILHHHHHHQPVGSAAGEYDFSASDDGHLNVESRHVLVGREVSAHWSRSLPSRPRPRCLQLRRDDDGESGGSCDRGDRDPRGQTCGGAPMF